MERDKAIETVKSCINPHQSDALREALETLIPELKESEDDEIRKDLIEFVKQYGDNFYGQFSKASAISWLEKQGEQKPADKVEPKSKLSDDESNKVNNEANAPTEYGKYIDKCLNEASKHFFSKGEDKYSVADLFYAGVRCGESWLEKQGEQKSSWSEEDEKMFDSILEEITPYGECPDYPNEEEREYYYDGMDKVNWFKALKDKYKDAVEYDKICLEKQGKKDKLTDDRRLIKTTIAFLKDYADKGYENAVECIDWLEKQGEKSSNKLQASDELYEHIRNTCACIDDALSSKTLADIHDYLSMARHSAQSAFDMIEKQGEQKSEWNEEDEKMVDSIIEDVRPCGECPNSPTVDERDYYYKRSKMVDWLESLKLQSHWKPTEEQMQTLHMLMTAASTFPEDKRVLTALYEDLQKLWKKNSAFSKDVQLTIKDVRDDSWTCILRKYKNQEDATGSISKDE